MSDSGSKPLPDFEGKIDEKTLDAAIEKANEAPVVNIKCRASSHVDGRPGASSGDADLKGSRCSSSTAYDMTKVIPHLPPGAHLYKCTECGYQWSVAVGGSFNF